MRHSVRNVESLADVCMRRIMLYLETMDTAPTAAIIAIGAVEFDEHTLGREFYRVVDLQSSMDAGGREALFTSLSVACFLKVLKNGRKKNP